MNEASGEGFFDNQERTRNLALGLGALGGPLVAIGIAAESVLVLVLGVVALAASGAMWTIRGIKEDQLAET